MFVKNFNSIKRQTVSVNDNVKNYLMQNRHSPISKMVMSGFIFQMTKYCL